jgi:DNA-binding MarR family transcriptional regulator
MAAADSTRPVSLSFDQAEAINGAIRTISIKHRARAAAMFAELGLHPGQEAVLLQLDAYGPQNQRQLAAGARCEPPSITGMVRKLEAAGLVERHTAADDARAQVVSLTDQGRRVNDRLRELWQELAELTVAHLQGISVDEVTRALTAVAASLQESVTE